MSGWQNSPNYRQYIDQIYLDSGQPTASGSDDRSEGENSDHDDICGQDLTETLRMPSDRAIFTEEEVHMMQEIYNKCDADQDAAARMYTEGPVNKLTTLADVRRWLSRSQSGSSVNQRHDSDTDKPSFYSAGDVESLGSLSTLVTETLMTFGFKLLMVVWRANAFADMVGGDQDVFAIVAEVSLLPPMGVDLRPFVTMCRSIVRIMDIYSTRFREIGGQILQKYIDLALNLFESDRYALADDLEMKINIDKLRNINDSSIKKANLIRQITRTKWAISMSLKYPTVDIPEMDEDQKVALLERLIKFMEPFTKSGREKWNIEELHGTDTAYFFKLLVLLYSVTPRPVTAINHVAEIIGALRKFDISETFLTTFEELNILFVKKYWISFCQVMYEEKNVAVKLLKNISDRHNSLMKIVRTKIRSTIWHQNGPRFNRIQGVVENALKRRAAEKQNNEERQISHGLKRKLD